VDLKQRVFCHYDKVEMDAHIIRISGGLARRVSGGNDPIYLYRLISGT